MILYFFIRKSIFGQQTPTFPFVQLTIFVLKRYHKMIKLFNYDLISVWGAYVENLYDLVSIIHRVLPKHIYFDRSCE